MFLRGVAIGVAIAAPVGPIGVLCIRRTLAGGRASGFVSGLGAATADAVYAAVAAFGLTAVSNILVGQQVWLRLLGGAFLSYLGVRILTAPPPVSAHRESGGTLLGAYASTLALTLTNPMTILSFGAVFAGLRLVGEADFTRAALLVFGVFLGSATWWLILSGAAGAWRTRLGEGGLRWINRVSGAVILTFGVLAWVGALLSG